MFQYYCYCYYCCYCYYYYFYYYYNYYYCFITVIIIILIIIVYYCCFETMKYQYISLQYSFFLLWLSQFCVVHKMIVAASCPASHRDLSVCVCYRDFAYVARDRVSRKHMCHVFRCDTPARTIANTLRDICKKIMIERSLQQNLNKPLDTGECWICFAHQ